MASSRGSLGELRDRTGVSSRKMSRNTSWNMPADMKRYFNSSHQTVGYIRHAKVVSMAHSGAVSAKERCRMKAEFDVTEIHCAGFLNSCAITSSRKGMRCI